MCCPRCRCASGCWRCRSDCATSLSVTLPCRALRLFLGALKQSLRAHSAGADPIARLGAIAFIHRFGSALNAHVHFHCVVVDGVFTSRPTGNGVFHPATAIDQLAIATVQAKVPRRLLASFVRRGLLAHDDAQAMAQWADDGGFSVDVAVRIEATGRAGRCVIAPAHRSPWNGCLSSTSNASATIPPHPGPTTVAR